jgi:multiple sugar transport system substrate-binding protein
MKIRSLFTLFAVLIVAAMLLGACAPAAATQAPAPAEPAKAEPAKAEPTKAEPTKAPEKPAAAVKVSYWHSMSNPETEQLAKVIAAFEAKNPGVKIEATRYSSDDDSFKKAMLTAAAGNSFPDAARMDIAWVPQYADDGVLQQLDGSMPDFEALKSAVFPGPLSTNLWKGHYYGLPLNTNTQVLLWNKDLFAQVGINDAPKTMEEFAAAACKLSDKGKELYGYAQGGTYFWAPAPIFYAMGGKIVDDKMTTATGVVNGKESVAAFTMLKDLYTKGCLSPNLMGGGIPTDAGHATGKYAMIVDGPWMVDIYKKNYPDFKVNFALIPAGPDGKTSSVVGGEDIVVFQTTQSKDAAFKWVSFLLSAEAQKMMAQVGVMPTLSGLKGDKDLPAYFGIFMDQLQTAQARVPHPNWGKMDDAVNQAYQRILRGDQPVQTALDQAAKEIDALLK